MLRWFLNISTEERRILLAIALPMAVIFLAIVFYSAIYWLGYYFGAMAR